MEIAYHQETQGIKLNTSKLGITKENFSLKNFVKIRIDVGIQILKRDK